jgi:hypothetical protein
MAKVERGSELWKALESARFVALVALGQKIPGFGAIGEMKNQMIMLDKEELVKSDLVIAAYNEVKDRLLAISLKSHKSLKNKDYEDLGNRYTFIIKILDKELGLNKICESQPRA